MRKFGFAIGLAVILGLAWLLPAAAEDAGNRADQPSASTEPTAPSNQAGEALIAAWAARKADPALAADLAAIGLAGDLAGLLAQIETPLWVGDIGVNEAGLELMARLGLVPTDLFDQARSRDALIAAFAGPTMGDRAEAEAILTAIALQAGRLALAPFGPVDDANLLEALQDGELDSVLPTDPGYWPSLVGWRNYSALAEAGGWGEIPQGAKLEPGGNDARVPALRQRLAISDGLTLDPAATDTIYDPALAEAVMRFQARHGLVPDGIIGHRTIDALNLPAEERLAQLTFNLAKMLARPERWGDRYIAVNIAAAELVLVSGGNEIYRTNVIVGRTDRPTPLIASAMDRLEFNPYWTVPPKIARVDLLPKQQANPRFFQEHNIRVYSSWTEDSYEIDPSTIDWFSDDARAMRYRLKQDPGPENALGPAKFLFPNQYDVYIHGTNHPELFVKQERFLSSGCVRVPDPLRFAELVLSSEGGWTAEKIQAVIDGAENQRVNLGAPLPVHLYYRTAWADPDGTVQFRRDIYGRDQESAESLIAELEGK